FAPHPRKIGWFGTAALAMGGSNQSLFLVGALIIGQGAIPGQGTAAVPLLIVGLVLSLLAAPGWIELTLMWPNRVGGLAATCGEAFRPYAPVLGNLTGMAYWWGWVPTCGIGALLSASALHQWFLPSVPVPPIAVGIVLTFTAVNLLGVWWPARLAMPIATISGVLAFLAAFIPVVTGRVDWHQAFDFQLETPFPGLFGQVTSAMAGLYLVGFAAPAFEASLCHVGETIDPQKNVPRAVWASFGMACLYFLVIPVVWLGTIGRDGLSGDLAITLGPVFAPLFGSLAKSAAIWFMMFNMFHGTLAPLTGVARTLSQLSEDGLLPEVFSRRNRFDCPWVAITFTATAAIAFLLAGDPVWMIAAADFTYLIGISLPSVAVWLLRRDQPDHPRLYRAPDWTITAGLVSAFVWGMSTVLGFQQFGLPTVLFGVALAYSGAALYAWRKYVDAKVDGRNEVFRSLHVKLTGAMLLVLVLDAAGYLLAVSNVDDAARPLVTALEDIFVAVAILTISVGLVLPGMIAHSAVQVTHAAERLASGTLADLARAMEALSAGDLDAAHARVDFVPVHTQSRDELGAMAESFNTMQAEVARSARGLAGAREGLRAARDQLTEANASLELRVVERTAELKVAHRKLVEVAWKAGMAEVAIGVLHNVGNVLNSLNVSATVVQDLVKRSRVGGLGRVVGLLDAHQQDLPAFLGTDPKGRQVPAYLRQLDEHLRSEHLAILAELESLTRNVDHVRQIVRQQQVYASGAAIPAEEVDPRALVDDAVRMTLGDAPGVTVERTVDPAPVMLDKHKVLQVLVNLLSNARHAVEAKDTGRRTVRVSVIRDPADPDRVRFEVADDGVGIGAEHLGRVFEHGFTTRRDGHGFGLHTSALAARGMGGSLSVHSDGLGHGARFVLDIPRVRSAEVAA
ncbi:MAG: amino acid permease, partial [Myxococcota bacterium]